MKRLFSLIFICFVLVGCEDMIELEKQSYVIAIGVDQTDAEGLFNFSFQIAQSNSGDSSGSGGNMSAETIGIPSSDLISATDIANNFVTKKINLDHTRVIIVSEELARSDDFIRIIQPSTQTTQMRRNIQIIVTRENAETFLNATSPILVESPQRYYQFMLTRANETAVIPDADLHRFYQITEGKDDLFLAAYASTLQVEEDLEKPSIKKIAGELIKTGANPAEFMGSAVFQNGKMIDVLDAQETRIINILDATRQMDDILGGLPDPMDPQYSISGKFSQISKTKVDVQYDKDLNHAKMTITVPFEFEIVAIPSRINYSEDDELKDFLKKSIEEYYFSIINDFIVKTQESYKSDPFYWSLHVRPFFKDIPSFEKANWSEVIYPNADIKVDIQLQRLEFGKSLYDDNFSDGDN